MSKRRQLILLVVGAVLLPPEAQADLPKAKDERVTFTDAGPVSDLAEMRRRDPVIAKDMKEYSHLVRRLDLARESFHVRLPKGYDPAHKAPLLVWINSGNAGNVPHTWGGVLDERGFVVIGARKAGNARARWERYQLALTAAHSAQKRYAIDRDRIYVMGTSGGGRSASWLAIHYPDVFHGGLMMAGANGYGSDKRKMARPMKEYVEYARDNCRYVFIAGERDYNLPQMRSVRSRLRRDGFRHTWLLVMPGAGHDKPKPDWFSRAVKLLDSRKG